MPRSERPTDESIERWLVKRISELSDMDAREIDVREPFTTYGLSSRSAVVLSGELEEWLERPMSPTLVYDYPSVEALARHLASCGDEAEPG